MEETQPRAMSVLGAHLYPPTALLLSLLYSLRVAPGGPATLQDTILQPPAPIPAHRAINDTDISAQPFFHSWHFYDEINRSHSALAAHQIPHLN